MSHYPSAYLGVWLAYSRIVSYRIDPLNLPREPGAGVDPELWLQYLDIGGRFFFFFFFSYYMVIGYCLLVIIFLPDNSFTSS